VKISIFLGTGSSSIPTSGESPSPHTPSLAQPSLLDPRLLPPEFQPYLRHWLSDDDKRLQSLRDRSLVSHSTIIVEDSRKWCIHAGGSLDSDETNPFVPYVSM